MYPFERNHFGIVGAIWGHAIMGWKLTILSVIGIVALARKLLIALWRFVEVGEGPRGAE